MKKIFLLIFLFQIIFFVSVPPFQIPDESGHYENIFWLSKGKYPYQLLEKGKNYPSYVSEMEKYYLNKTFYFSLNKIKNNPLKNKKQTDFEKNLSKNFKPINFQSYHPFLYYLLLTPSQFLSNLINADLISRFYLTRLLSSTLFWIMIISIYKILKLLNLKEDDKKTFLLLYGLNPLVLYYSIGINPDLGIAIFSTFFLYLVFKFNKKLSFINLSILGLSSGLCYLNKTSGLSTVLFIILIVFYQEKNWLKRIKKNFVFILFFLLTASPWIYLHLTRYQTMSTPSFYIAHERPIKPNGFFFSFVLAFLEFRHTIMHYSGFFGSTNQFWPPKIYFIFYTLITSFLFFISFLKFFKKYLILSFYLISAFVFFYLLAFYFKKTGFSWDVQGRHFLLAFFPFYFFVYQGLKNIFSQRINLFIKIFSLINIIIFIFFLMLPDFYQKENIIQALNIVYPYFGNIFAGSILLIILDVCLLMFFNQIKRNKNR